MSCVSLMPPRLSFQMVMRIDDDGVVLTRFRGTFDAALWLREQRKIEVADFPDMDFAGRPVVCDIRDCLLPAAAWNLHFGRVHRVVARRHAESFRFALVIGDDIGKEFAAKLFVEVGKSMPGAVGEADWFADAHTAYAWVTERWSAG